MRGPQKDVVGDSNAHSNQSGCWDKNTSPSESRFPEAMVIARASWDFGSGSGKNWSMFWVLCAS